MHDKLQAHFEFLILSVVETVGKCKYNWDSKTQYFYLTLLLCQFLLCTSQ